MFLLEHGRKTLPTLENKLIYTNTQREIEKSINHRVFYLTDKEHIFSDYLDM